MSSLLVFLPVRRSLHVTSSILKLDYVIPNQELSQTFRALLGYLCYDVPALHAAGHSGQ
jgi:hypothetical protein